MSPIVAARIEPSLRIAVLLAATATALGLRLVVAGPAGAHSIPAGLVFAGALAAVVLVARPRLRTPGSAWGWGALAGVAICLPALAARGFHVTSIVPAGWFPQWALVVSLVAVAEELVFRGALYEAIERAQGERWAIAVTTVAFALIHVPLYGWAALPLDLAVGFLLGVLRAETRSVAAPAVAHTLADLYGWWLR